jgi:hypothetical protein
MDQAPAIKLEFYAYLGAARWFLADELLSVSGQ